MPPRSVSERELVDPVVLCLPDGRLNPSAVGWSRRPLHDTSGIGRGRLGLGRNKRWEYWAIVSPTHLIAVTVSSLDYAGVHSVMVHDRRTTRTVERGSLTPLRTGATLPPSLGDGAASAVTRALTIRLDETAPATRITASADGVELDVTVDRPVDHDALCVVVPWSSRRFQYTVKDIGRPAHGRLRIGDEVVDLGEGTWAALDHGRGRWPYRMRWNWGAGAGSVAGEPVSLQLGGRWTDGSGSTENGVFVGGRLHKLSEELDWAYDESDWLRPWHIRGAAVDLRFEPFWDHASVTEFGVIGSRGHQCFGHYTGRVDIDGRSLELDSMVGWAEDVRNRW